MSDRKLDLQNTSSLDAQVPGARRRTSMRDRQFFNHHAWWCSATVQTNVVRNTVQHRVDCEFVRARRFNDQVLFAGMTRIASGSSSRRTPEAGSRKRLHWRTILEALAQA